MHNIRIDFKPVISYLPLIWVALDICLLGVQCVHLSHRYVMCSILRLRRRPMSPPMWRAGVGLTNDDSCFEMQRVKTRTSWSPAVREWRRQYKFFGAVATRWILCCSTYYRYADNTQYKNSCRPPAADPPLGAVFVLVALLFWVSLCNWNALTRRRARSVIIVYFEIPNACCD